MMVRVAAKIFIRPSMPHRPALVVVFQHGLERLGGLPFRVLRRVALDFVEGEQELEVHRLLAPKGLVVVEHRDAVFGFDEVLAALIGDGLDEFVDALFRGAVILRGQGLGGLHQQGPAQGQRQQKPEPQLFAQ